MPWDFLKTSSPAGWRWWTTTGLYLHYVISRRRDEGNTQNLIRSWLSDGYDVRVVMPRPIMQHILRKFRFVPSFEYLPGQVQKTTLKSGIGRKFSHILS